MSASGPSGPLVFVYVYLWVNRFFTPMVVSFQDFFLNSGLKVVEGQPEYFCKQ